LTVEVGGSLTGPGGGQTAIYTGAGGQTALEQGLAGGQTARAYFGRQKSISSAKDFPWFSTDSNLETTQKSLRTKKRNSGAHSKFWTTFS
jgi:hypothetical protein